MRADELRALLDRRPFEPIRLHISSGQTVDIKHPEMALVTRSLVVVGVNESDERVAGTWFLRVTLGTLAGGEKDQVRQRTGGREAGDDVLVLDWLCASIRVLQEQRSRVGLTAEAAVPQEMENVIASSAGEQPDDGVEVGRSLLNLVAAPFQLGV